MICFPAWKQNRLSPNPSTKRPINPQETSQELIKQHKLSLRAVFVFLHPEWQIVFGFFLIYKPESSWNALMLLASSGDTLLCQQCQTSHVSETKQAAHIQPSNCSGICTHRLCVGYIHFPAQGFTWRWWLPLLLFPVCLCAPHLLVFLMDSHTAVLPLSRSLIIYQPFVTEIPFRKLLATDGLIMSLHFVW